MIYAGNFFFGAREWNWLSVFFSAFITTFCVRHDDFEVEIKREGGTCDKRRLMTAFGEMIGNKANCGGDMR